MPSWSICALFFLVPLYVMLVTSLKGMPEIRQGYIVALPAAPSFAAWVKAWSAACTGLSCNGIRVGFVNSLRILVPSVILSIAVGRDHRLRVVVLASARRRAAVRHPDRRRLHPLSGVHLSAGADLLASQPEQLARRYRHHPHDLRPADDDADLPQLFRGAAARNCSRPHASTAPASGASSASSCCRWRCRSSSSR